MLHRRHPVETDGGRAIPSQVSADEFDIGRPKRANLSFAVGPHYCIGHYFARAQLAVAIRMLFDRFPRLRLDPDDEPVYRGHEYRSPKSLRVLLD